MKIIKRAILAITIVSLSACQVFLGPDPDNTPRGIFDRIWTDFDQNYALMEVKGIDWDGVYQTYSPRITSGMSEQELFAVCGDMLKTLNDSHVYLAAPFGYVNSGSFYDTANADPFSLDVIKGYLQNQGSSAGDGMFLYGTFESYPRIGYIHIAGFAHGNVGMSQSQDWVQAIDGIVRSLEETDSLILDLRGNRGGLVSNVDYISGRFASAEKKYAEIRTKDGPGSADFSAPLYNSIKPAGIRYTKPIVLLTNKQTISGGEWFTLALRSQDHVIHTGGATNGAFSLSLERTLINGWRYSMSVQKVTDMNGICYEGTGIMPSAEHVRVNTAEEIAVGKDTQLEYAVGLGE
jgi:hypothetical protein